MKIFSSIKAKINKGKKIIALLIDPDKCSKAQLEVLKENSGLIDLILVGGSFTFKHVGDVIDEIKSVVDIPILLFPGDVTQLTDKADALLMLSLISGRNPEYLIGNHVLAAPRIYEYGLETIPTGYIIINGGKETAVSYVSNTNPIPSDQHDIVVATALAGKYLGLQMIYLEAGSGAINSASTDLIKKVKKSVDLPLIVGGGIRSKQQALDIFNAGADVIVIGSLFESDPKLLKDVLQGVKN